MGPTSWSGGMDGPAAFVCMSARLFSSSSAEAVDGVAARRRPLHYNGMERKDKDLMDLINNFFLSFSPSLCLSVFDS